jgi:hypothetical protein
MLRKQWPSIREAVIATGVKPDRVEAHLRGRLFNLPARQIYFVGKWFKSEQAKLIDDLITNFAACRSRSDLESCYFAYREDPRRNPNKLVKKLLQPNRRKLLRTYDIIRGESEAIMGFSVRVD